MTQDIAVLSDPYWPLMTSSKYAYIKNESSSLAIIVNEKQNAFCKIEEGLGSHCRHLICLQMKWTVIKLL